jgi:hypothetical protein
MAEADPKLPADPAVTPPVDPNPVDAPLLGGGGDPDPVDPPADPAGPSWREDWRDRLAGEDEAFGKHLKRFASPENFAKSYRELEKRLKSGVAPAALAEGATEEQVAAYCKAHGIPEAPDGYGLSFGEGAQVTEAAKATLGEFAKAAHDLHVPPSQAKGLFEWWNKQAEAGRVAQAEAMQEARVQNLAELKSEWKGREFDRNIRITQDWLAKAFEGDEDVLDALLAAKMPDGVTRVGDHAKVLKRLNAAALAQADDVALIAGDVGGSGKSRADRKNELLDKSAAAKLTKAEDAELSKLFELQVAEEARAGRSRVRA